MKRNGERKERKHFNNHFCYYIIVTKSPTSSCSSYLHGIYPQLMAIDLHVFSCKYLSLVLNEICVCVHSTRTLSINLISI